MKKYRAGFTLVELSIVLVILGLLIGGVLTGQSLIRAAELRSVSTQYARYQAAVMTFRDKYFALPADMANATAYWGIAAGTGSDATCRAAASTDAKTCNGNGDGQILLALSSYEPFRFWQHLANAGLIEGSYDGITHGSSAVSATTVNSPAGRISSSLWFAQYFGALSGSSNYFDGQYDNAFLFGGVRADQYPSTALMKSEEAYNIDKKLDDGKPGSGRLVVYQDGTGWTGTACTDATASTQISANYYLQNTSLICALFFRNAF